MIRDIWIGGFTGAAIVITSKIRGRNKSALQHAAGSKPLDGFWQCDYTKADFARTLAATQDIFFMQGMRLAC